MFSKLSSSSGYHFSRVDESNNIIQSRYYHDDVSDMVLIYQEAQSTWSRGHTMKQRRFGHSSILYARGLYHIGGGLNYKSPQSTMAPSAGITATVQLQLF